LTFCCSWTVGPFAQSLPEPGAAESSVPPGAEQDDSASAAAIATARAEPTELGDMYASGFLKLA